MKLHFGTLFAFLSLAPTAISQAAAPDVSVEEAKRIVAPSPLRELNRAWKQCADETLFVAKINGMSSVPQVESLVSFGCDGYESRLTGELVKRLGYVRGNSVIAALKRDVRSRIQGQISQQAAKPKDVYSREANQAVVRRPDGTCSGMIQSSNLIEPTDTMILFDRGGWKIIFIKEISYAARYEPLKGTVEAVTLKIVRGGQPPLKRRQALRLEVDRQFIGWSMAIDDATITWMSNASSAEFESLREEQSFPRVFPIQGLAALWKDVKACSTSRS